MPKQAISLDAGFYESDSLPISAQECVNFWVNITQTSGSLSPASLYGGAGISQEVTTGKVNQTNRGAHVKAGKPYFLNGQTLVRLDRSVDEFGEESFTAVSLGIIPGDTRVSMADNGKELMVLVPGGNAYIINEESGTPFQQITAPGFTASGNPQQVVFIDSYFVCSTDSKKFIRSNSNDGLTWDSLNFYSAESDPDDIVGLQVYNNRLFVLGSEVTEEFANNAGIFQRTGFFIDKGLYAPFSTISTNNSFMWIGGGTNERAAIWTLNGNTPTKVSTTAIDVAIQDFTNEQIQNAFAYSYALDGAYFVGFSFPTRTFEINTVTGRWNERKSQFINTKGLTEVIRWRANSLVTAYNKIFCGDSQDGRIGSVSPDTYSEYGNEIIRTFATQPLSNLGDAISVPELELTMEAGVGDLSTTNPLIGLEVSKDSRKYSDPIKRKIGKIGEFYKRTIWHKLGRFPRWVVFRFTLSDKVKPVIISLEVRARGGQRGN